MPAASKKQEDFMTACYHGWKPKKKKGKKKIKCPQKKVAKKFMKAKESVLPKFDEVYLRMLHEAEKCKNKNIYHSWATHVAHRECAEYGVGEVLRHTLNEQGKVQFFDVKFGNKVISNIPTHLLEKKKKKVHKH